MSALAEASITIIGNIGNDPELKFFNSGKAYAKFSVAVGSRKQVDGNWVDGETSWFNCTAFEKQAENVVESLPKGTRVIVKGVQVQRTWEDDAGVKKSAFDVRAEEVGPLLRYATAVVTKNPREGGSATRNEVPSNLLESELGASAFDEEPF